MTAPPPSVSGSQENWGRGARRPDEERFLEGPRARGTEFLFAVRVFLEFLRGFRSLHFVGPCVTVFGSARFGEDHPEYARAREIGERLARLGFTVMTGGGPGVMEAANRGAKEAGGVSIGCNIELPAEQQPSRFLDRMIEFRYFFVRKVLLAKYSYAFVALPGGFGTFDEIFETATLVQTGKMKDFPLILVGRAYWQPMLDFLRVSPLAAGAIDRQDVDRFFVTDSPEEVADYIRESAATKFGFRWALPAKRRWFLGERATRVTGTTEPRASAGS